MSYSFNPFSGNFDNVRDISGTTNQVNVAQAGDNFTLSTPQDIHTGATPQFQDVQVIGTGLGNRLVGKTLAQLSSTGVSSGLTLSINADPTKFDIAAGTYEIVDNYTNPAAPVVTPVTYAGSTANTLTYLATTPATYILLDSAGAITQQTTYPTPSERRAKALIGRLAHQNNTVITFANTFPDIKNGIVSQFYDLCDAMAPFKIGGLSITANGANLSFNRSSGSAFFRSASWVATPSNPHTLNFTSQTLQPFRKMTQTTIVDVSDVTVVEPNYYDVGGVRTLNGGGNGTATIQRVYLYKSGGVRVAYGQTVYTNLATALSRINQDPFVPNPTIEQSAILIGYIVLTKDCTDLTNTNKARLLTAARFDAGGSAASGGITSLQQAYNNSILPQIILSSDHGAFTIDDASTPIGTLVDIRNNAGTTSFMKVDASGTHTTNFTGTGTTGAVRLHNLTTTQRNALTPAAGMIVYDTTLNQMQGYANGDWGELTRELQAANISLAAGAELAISLTHSRQTWLVAGASAPVTLSATPFGSAEPVYGAEITLIGNSDANPVTIPVNDASFGVIGYSVTLGKGQVATYKYNGTLLRYVIKSVSN